MDRPRGLVEQDDRKAILLLLYADATQAGALLQLLPEKYETISCSVSAPLDHWLEELQPEIILLHPPSEQRQFLKSCETLRAQTDRPIVVLSERSEELLITRVLAAGIDEYLIQPIGERELAARIGAMLRRIRRYTGPNEASQLGGLILTSSDLSVELDGRRLFLTPIEFRLLSCLASAPGKVLTHQTLMARIWGPEYVDSRH